MREVVEVIVTILNLAQNLNLSTFLGNHICGIYNTSQ